MSASTPGALLVDLDNTILVYDGVARPTWDRLCRAYAPGLGVDPVRLRDAIERTAHWYWSDEHRFRTGRQDLTASRRAVVGMAFDALGLDGTAVRDVLADRYNAEREVAMHPFEGAVEALRTLREAGWRMALMTNGASDRQRAKVERFDLDGLFDSLHIEGELGFGKPDPRVYRGALQALAVTPAQAWAVGDGLTWDVDGPQREGVRGIWVDWRGTGLPADTGVQPDHIIQGLAELPALLARVDAGEDHGGAYVG